MSTTHAVQKLLSLPFAQEQNFKQLSVTDIGEKLEAFKGAAHVSNIHQFNDCVTAYCELLFKVESDPAFPWGTPLADVLKPQAKPAAVETPAAPVAEVTNPTGPKISIDLAMPEGAEAVEVVSDLSADLSADLPTVDLSTVELPDGALDVSLGDLSQLEMPQLDADLSALAGKDLDAVDLTQNTGLPNMEIPLVDGDEKPSEEPVPLIEGMETLDVETPKLDLSALDALAKSIEGDLAAEKIDTNVAPLVAPEIPATPGLETAPPPPAPTPEPSINTNVLTSPNALPKLDTIPGAEIPPPPPEVISDAQNLAPDLPSMTTLSEDTLSAKTVAGTPEPLPQVVQSPTPPLPPQEPSLPDAHSAFCATTQEFLKMDKSIHALDGMIKLNTYPKAHPKLKSFLLFSALDAELMETMLPRILSIWEPMKQKLGTLFMLQGEKQDLLPPLKGALEQICSKHDSLLLDKKFPYSSLIGSLKYLESVAQPEKFQPQLMDFAAIVFLFGQEHAAEGAVLNNHLQLHFPEPHAPHELFLRLSRCHKLRNKGAHALHTLTTEEIGLLDEDVHRALMLISHMVKGHGGETK